MIPASGSWLLAAATCVGVFGLLIGSFLNVVIYRVPNGISIVSPPSACPACGQAIKAYDNIPVASWLLLRGQCRSCAVPIPKRYPLVEAGTGAAFAAVALWMGTGMGFGLGLGIASAPATPGPTALPILAGFLYLAAISIALGLIDLDVHRLPDAIVLPGYAVGAVLLGGAGLLGGDHAPLLRAAVGMAALGAAYLAMALAYPGGMGLGDVKLAGLLGMFLGWTGWGALAVGAFAAFILGGLYSLVLIAAGKANRKSGIPFGPWMLLGAWTGIFLGNPLWKGYLALIGL